ncbi:hypothetical protein M3Y94_01077800 [Aphelenchoides besseyi]|nr:hypothetical protein M3Y94_01077800 [Aphelenchoides besseyi]KAI6218764.1 hypothetical protein M3Y95_01150500 [Aphelenchoides besseyi]
MSTESFGRTVRQIHVYYEIVMAIISYVLNFLVLWLAITKSTKTMSSYRIIILLSCVVDLIFITVNLIAMGIVDMHNGHLFMFSGGFFVDFDHPMPLLMNIIWLWGVNITIVNIPMIFLHRHSVFCRSVPLSSLQFFGIYGLFIVWITLHSIGFVFCFDYGEKSKALAPLLHTNQIYADVKYYIVGNSESVLGILHMMNIQAIVVVSYGIVVWTSRKIFRKLAETRSHMSTATLEAQKQLTFIMFFQACVPFIVICIPVLGAVMTTVLHLDNPFIGFFLASLTAFIPIFNSVCIIVVIPSFRRALISIGSKIIDTSASEMRVTSLQQNPAVGDVQEHF